MKVSDLAVVGVVMLVIGVLIIPVGWLLSLQFAPGSPVAMFLYYQISYIGWIIGMVGFIALLIGLSTEVRK